MRRFLILLAIVMAMFAIRPLGASVCDAKGRKSTLQPGGLSIDHYIYDAALHHRWAVMVDCEHPDWPWTLQSTPWESGAGITELRSKHVGGAVAAMPLISAGTK